MNESSGGAPVALNSRVRAHEDVLYQELQGEVVLLNLNSGMYFGLDPVGARMWQLIVEKEELSEVARSIVEEFEVSGAQCAADLLVLVEQLKSRGLVTVSA